ncbi:hypothetical protein LCGC14_1706430 [marine sediment metagenome]|uniref:N-acetyltransferase domain-containing protein n=1 Tax=marine sediment metagenome TaxID=412755 RepID=A0A0F9KGI1_9ZZZZ
MIAFRRIKRLPPPKREQLACVMACDGEESRYGEFLSWLEEDFVALDHSRRAYIVAECDGVIVGFVRVWHSPHVKAWFNDGMVVAPAFRRQGIGRDLLARALQLAERMGARSLISQIRKSNTASIRLHENAGFVPDVTDGPDPYGSPRPAARRQYRIRVQARGE